MSPRTTQQASGGSQSAVESQPATSKSTAANNASSNIGARTHAGNTHKDSSPDRTSSASSSMRSGPSSSAPSAASNVTKYAVIPNNVYIRGLDESTTDRVLMMMCSPYGTIVSLKAIIDTYTQLCKGYGFVMYASPQQAAAAISGLTAQGYSASLARVGPRVGVYELQHFSHSHDHHRFNHHPPTHHGHHAVQKPKHNLVTYLNQYADATSKVLYITNLPTQLSGAEVFNAFKGNGVEYIRLLYEGESNADEVVDQITAADQSESGADHGGETVDAGSEGSPTQGSSMAESHPQMEKHSSNGRQSRGVGFAKFVDRASAEAFLAKYNSQPFPNTGETESSSSLPLYIRFADTPAQRRLKVLWQRNRYYQDGTEAGGSVSEGDDRTDNASASGSDSVSKRSYSSTPFRNQRFYPRQHHGYNRPQMQRYPHRTLVSAMSGVSLNSSSSSPPIQASADGSMGVSSAMSAPPFVPSESSPTSPTPHDDQADATTAPMMLYMMHPSSHQPMSPETTSDAPQAYPLTSMSPQMHMYAPSSSMPYMQPYPNMVYPNMAMPPTQDGTDAQQQAYYPAYYYYYYYYPYGNEYAQPADAAEPAMSQPDDQNDQNDAS